MFVFTSLKILQFFQCQKKEQLKETRPDTWQSSHGWMGRSSYAKTARNSKRLCDRWTNGLTDQPTDTARCRVACPRLKTKWLKFFNIDQIHLKFPDQIRLHLNKLINPNK